MQNTSASGWTFAPVQLGTLILFINSMEKPKLDYQANNIPIPLQSSYKLQLINKIELIIKEMGCKALFFNQDNYEQDALHNMYRCKSMQCPPLIRELSPLIRTGEASKFLTNTE